MLTLAELRELARRAGFPDVDTAAAIAMAESTGDPSARGAAGEVGLWQIHPPSHPEFDVSRLTEPDYNARAALLISRGGTDWHQWSTWRHGDFRRYMPVT
jgi:soluble lytic murein transglycosylase-like protein